MFHVPEQHRIIRGPLGSDLTWVNNGRFIVPPSSTTRQLLIIASDGMGWEHVSVHAEENGRDRTPVWHEMCVVKELFWDDGAVVMQLHPAKSEYVNNHPHTLHLWRPVDAPIPTPPSIMVGIKSLGILSR